MVIGDRIRAARIARGWSQGQLGREAGVSQTGISSWERNRTEPTRDDVKRLARALGVRVDAIEATSHETSESVAVIGYVGAGSIATLFSEGQGPFDTVEPPADTTPNTVALKVQGQSLGIAFDGALVFYDDVRSPVTPDLFGRLCVVGLEDGRVLVKVLRSAGGGAFHLISNVVEEPMLNIGVSWAARVKDIRPQ